MVWVKQTNIKVKANPPIRANLGEIAVVGDITAINATRAVHVTGIIGVCIAVVGITVLLNVGRETKRMNLKEEPA